MAVQWDKGKEETKHVFSPVMPKGPAGQQGLGCRCWSVRLREVGGAVPNSAMGQAWVEAPSCPCEHDAPWSVTVLMISHHTGLWANSVPFLMKNGEGMDFPKENSHIPPGADNNLLLIHTCSQRSFARTLQDNGPTTSSLGSNPACG